MLSVAAWLAKLAAMGTAAVAVGACRRWWVSTARQGLSLVPVAVRSQGLHAVML